MQKGGGASAALMSLARGFHKVAWFSKDVYEIFLIGSLHWL